MTAGPPAPGVLFLWLRRLIFPILGRICWKADGVCGLRVFIYSLKNSLWVVDAKGPRSGCQDSALDTNHQPGIEEGLAGMLDIQHFVYNLF